jgi:glycosyltransferase involved in cell wall biosynthesis
MNISFDLVYTQTASNQRGIGRYASNLIEAIKKIDKKNSHYFFKPQLICSEMDFKNQVQYFIWKHKIDVFHIMSPFDYWFNLKKEWFLNVKVAVIFYDAIPWIYPEVYFLNPFFKMKYNNILEFIKTCDMIFTISETSKRDGVTYGGFAPEKVKVIYGGLDPQFKVIQPFSLKMVTEKFKITKPYIFYTGGMDFRKNIPRLVEAFKQANRELNHKYQLVISGTVNPQTFSLLQEQDVIYTGYVSNEDLVKLYNGAVLFVFPSLYEGLGFPVLEAMACGTPVLTSNTSSLVEIGKDVAYLVNPYDVDEIAKGMVYLLSNEVILDELRKRGLKHVQSFQWDVVAKKVVERYK